MIRAVLLLAVVAVAVAPADPVPVRFREGVVRGFLVLTDTAGDTLAHGELLQTARGDTVDTRLRFTFPDGSVHDEQARFTQARVFRLLSYRILQRGAAFPDALTARLDAINGRWSATGGGETHEGQIEVRDDLYTGVLLVIAKNLAGRPVTVHHVAFTPKAQVVGLDIAVAGDEPARVGDHPRPATHYVIKPDLGVVRGLLASLIGEHPPDHHIWIVREPVPGFVRFEGPLYLGGPPWRIELAAPRID